MTVYERIKEIAKKRGMNLQTVAKNADLSSNMIYQYKTVNPKMDTLKTLADVLGVSTDYLLGNTNDIHTNNKSTDNEPVDIKKVAENDTWDNYLSSDGRPLSDHDKKLLRAIFGD